MESQISASVVGMRTDMETGRMAAGAVNTGRETAWSHREEKRETAKGSNTDVARREPAIWCKENRV